MAPNNPLVTWGNEKTMNLNTLILTNIQSSPYFKVKLFELKTFHEVVDEIYYRVEHLEPWEKGSRKTAGQTGMCGGVRGVGAGGIVSSAYCLLFKLFTLKLTKKQLNNLITHSDSPYIRGLGFMYIRYTQPPSDLWDWYEPYLDDDEEMDVKAGGGHMMTIGEMLRQWLIKLEWYSTLFPRIPVPIQKELDVKLRSRPVVSGYQGYGDEYEETHEPQHIPDEEVSFGEAEKAAMSQRGRSRGSAYPGPSRSDVYNGRNARQSPYRRQSPSDRRSPRRSPPRRHDSPYSRSDDFSRELDRERERQKREKDRDRDYRDRDREYREKDRDYRDRDRDRDYRDKDRERDRDYKRSKEEKRRSRSRSRERSRDRSKKEHHRDRDSRKEKKSSKHKEKHRDKDRDRKH